MIALLRYWQVTLGGLLGAILMFGVSAAILQPQAHERGREAERAAALERSMEIIQERSRTNEAVRDLDAAGICRELGGVFTEGECR
jgi:hypothetical protein